MSIRDLLNSNKPNEQPRGYKAPVYTGRKFNMGGRLFMQSLVAVLLFIGIGYAVNLDNDYAEEVKAALSWAMESEGIGLPVMSLAPQEEEEPQPNQQGAAPNVEQGDLLMILPASGVLAKSFGQADETGKVKSFGVEIAGIAGQPVKAAADGKVAAVEKQEKGYRIEIKHTDAVLTVYGFIGEPKVSVGESIRKGNVIGTVGEAAVFFAVKENGTPVDPFLYLGGPQSINDSV